MGYLLRKTNVAYEFSKVDEEGEQIAPILTEQIDYEDRIHSLCELARQARIHRMDFEREDVGIAGPSIHEFNVFFGQYLIERA